MQWHDIRDPQDPELDRLAERYNLHPLHIEDCRHRNQNAKIEEGHGYLFTVLKPVSLDNESIVVCDLDLFLGPDYLITVIEGDSPPVRHLLNSVCPDPKIPRADQAYYRVVDGVVDLYLPVLDHYAESIDELEDLVLENPTPALLARIFETKRNLILLRRVLVNTRDVANHLQRSESGLIQRDMWPFLRDIYDHVARNLDTVEMLRDLLTGSLDVYLSSVANRTNQVMKVLTVLGTVALPMLVLSSFWGMNLKDLPLVDSPHATLIVTGLMAASTAALLIVLRFFRWL